jgi:hypothetical protein
MVVNRWKIPVISNPCAEQNTKSIRAHIWQMPVISSPCRQIYRIDLCAHTAKCRYFLAPIEKKKYLENSLKLPTSVGLTKIMLGKNNRLNLYPSLNRPRKRAQKPETSILTVAQLYHVDVHGAAVPRPSGGGGGGASSRSSAPPPAPASPWHR